MANQFSKFRDNFLCDMAMEFAIAAKGDRGELPMDTANWCRRMLRLADRLSRLALKLCYMDLDEKDILQRDRDRLDAQSMCDPWGWEVYFSQDPRTPPVRIKTNGRLTHWFPDGHAVPVREHAAYQKQLEYQKRILERLPCSK